MSTTYTADASTAYSTPRHTGGALHFVKVTSPRGTTRLVRLHERVTHPGKAEVEVFTDNCVDKVYNAPEGYATAALAQFNLTAA